MSGYKTARAQTHKYHSDNTGSGPEGRYNQPSGNQLYRQGIWTCHHPDAVFLRASSISAIGSELINIIHLVEKDFMKGTKASPKGARDLREAEEQLRSPGSLWALPLRYLSANGRAHRFALNIAPCRFASLAMRKSGVRMGRKKDKSASRIFEHCAIGRSNARMGGGFWEKMREIHKMKRCLKP